MRNKLKNDKNYVFTAICFIYLASITIFIFSHKYGYRLLKSPIKLLFWFFIAIFIAIRYSNCHQQINKFCKVLILSLCISGITTFLLMKLILIKYPENYKKIISLTPVTSVNFMINSLIITAILSVTIIFTSKNFNKDIKNKKLDSQLLLSITDFLLLVYNILLILSVIITTVNLPIKDKDFSYTTDILLLCSFSASFELLRLFSKDNPLYLLIYNKDNYFLIWPLLSLMLSLATLFCK